MDTWKARIWGCESNPLTDADTLRDRRAKIINDDDLRRYIL